jgi:hypothetical protein
VFFRCRELKANVVTDRPRLNAEGLLKLLDVGRSYRKRHAFLTWWIIAMNRLIVKLHPCSPVHLKSLCSSDAVEPIAAQRYLFPAPGHDLIDAVIGA